jgi:SNF2 family DNA or RNA helicase
MYVHGYIDIYTYTYTYTYIHKCTGYLGSLAQFKAQTANKIICSKEPDANRREEEEGRKASASLRSLLSQIMLRRTQADILKKLLPPRTDVIVYCGLTPSQDREYEAAAAAMCRSLGLPKNEQREELERLIDEDRRQCIGRYEDEALEVHKYMCICIYMYI